MKLNFYTSRIQQYPHSISLKNPSTHSVMLIRLYALQLAHLSWKKINRIKTKHEIQYKTSECMF